MNLEGALEKPPTSSFLPSGTGRHVKPSPVPIQMLKTIQLTSFDGTESTRSVVARPERYGDLLKVLADSQPLIARGAGLSYSAASMGEQVTSVDMRWFNRILAFDDATGEIDVEPGIRVGSLVEFLAERGFGLPVVPGYSAITVGGCVAFDVHGKSQFHSGNFGEWVEEIELAHPLRGTISCSRSVNAKVFELTVGGFGLSGVILRVRLRTQRLTGSAVQLSTVTARNLEHAAEIMEANAPEVAALYSWHNLTRVGKNFGSGFVFIERVVDSAGGRAQKPGRFEITRRAPLPCWNTISSRLALGIYETLKRSQKPRVIRLRHASFPIEGLEGYYAAFGKRGLREYQLIVRRDQFGAFERALAKLVARERVPITLASLKLFRGTESQLRFRGSGICLAIDVPATPQSLSLFRGLDDLAERHGARVNLAKDSRLGAATCRRLFPQYEAFKSDLGTYDPERRCASKLRERIGV